MKKAMKAARRAFTLIELIVTVVIIGILAGIGLVAYNNITERAEDTADKTTLESLAREIKIMDAFDSLGGVTYGDVSQEVADSAVNTAGDAVAETDAVASGDVMTLGNFTLTIGGSAGELTTTVAP